MVMLWLRDDERTAGQLGEEAGELFVREVVPAAARVVLFLLHVARERKLIDELPCKLPAVGEVFELLARHARASLVEPGVAAPQASIAVAMKSLAEDAALRCDLADGVVVVSELDQLGAEQSDHFGPRNGFLFRQYAGHRNLHRQDRPATKSKPWGCAHAGVSDVTLEGRGASPGKAMLNVQCRMLNVEC